MLWSGQASDSYRLHSESIHHSVDPIGGLMIAADMMPLPLSLQKGRFRADTEWGGAH